MNPDIIELNALAYRSALAEYEDLKERLHTVRSTMKRRPNCAVKGCCSGIVTSGYSFMCHNHHLRAVRRLHREVAMPPKQKTPFPGLVALDMHHHCLQCWKVLVPITIYKRSRMVCTGCGCCPEFSNIDYHPLGGEWSHKQWTHRDWVHLLMSKLERQECLESDTESESGDSDSGSWCDTRSALEKEYFERQSNRQEGDHLKLKDWEIYMPCKWSEVWAKELVASLRIYNLVVLKCSRKQWKQYWEKKAR